MKKNGNGFIRYTTYNFVDKDPVIDVLRTAKREAKVNNKELSVKSNVSASTLGNWFGGKTKRPQFATVAAVAVALGMTELPLTSEGRKLLRESWKETHE
jgi:transcriptional regulator with XRE-family HTH domain